MKLAVFGATGGTGQEIVRQALADGHDVVAAVRAPGRLAVSHPRLDIAPVPDVTDVARVREVVDGRDAVLSALGTTNKSAGIVAPAARAVAEAMSTAGVRRLLIVSAVPVGPMAAGESLAYRAVLHPIVSRAFRAVYRDLAEMERIVTASGLDWTVVRPPRLLDKPPSHRYERVIGANVPGGRSLARADLAHAMLAMLDDEETVRRPVGVATAS
ncbi:NAD(P)H-binding protein [Streptomyces sp. MP131-18]|uniref:NAD(P)-dependent oxidoreductase n=1 Tax=Streptomyces sp. MP131-18 TaxID=1857892 RepID=UPI00097C7642|nr:NAD(P)H-binding protein [Streptomyces sp. MP131-18]ONK09713.1 putative NADH-flavin reductase [Streptomyces sp. MP131-18]